MTEYTGGGENNICDLQQTSCPRSVCRDYGSPGPWFLVHLMYHVECRPFHCSIFMDEIDLLRCQAILGKPSQHVCVGGKCGREGCPFGRVVHEFVRPGTVVCVQSSMIQRSRER